MFSVRLKQTHFPHTVPMISKLTSKKALNRLSVGCTLYPRPRFKRYASSLMRTSASVSFILPSRLMAPILFVKKKDGSLRLCVDFRSLNRITKKDCYPLPLISDLLDAPGRARIYMKIDLRHAYHLVQIADENEEKTTFHMCYGLFEWLVILEGLTNAPASFQRFMNNVFSDMIDVSVIVYLDNILIYSNNSVDHRKHIKEVL